MLMLAGAIVLGLAAFVFLRAIAKPLILAIAVAYVIFALGGGLTAPLPTLGQLVSGARPVAASTN